MKMVRGDGNQTLWSREGKRNDDDDLGEGGRNTGVCV